MAQPWLRDGRNLYVILLYVNAFIVMKTKSSVTVSYALVEMAPMNLEPTTPTKLIQPVSDYNIWLSSQFCYCDLCRGMYKLGYPLLECERNMQIFPVRGHLTDELYV